MKNFLTLSSLLSAGLFLTASPVLATSFTVSGADSSAKTLAAGQTGTVTSSGVLTISGSTIAVTITGSSTLTNSGTISQTGTGRAIRDNTGGLTLTVTNNAGALIKAADADVIQMNKSDSNVTVNNYGTFTSLNASAGGSQAIDFNAITTGTNTLYNYSTGILQASEADAVRPGVNGVVYNSGTIKSTTSTGSSSDGIDAQTNTGISITNDSSLTTGAGATNLIEGARHGITGGAVDATVNFTMNITNNSNGAIKGDNGSGINIDGFNNKEVVTITNAGMITGNGVTGDGDGVDVDGLVNLNNSGTILSKNSFTGTGTEVSEGVTVGGGSITNSGTIEGSVAAGNTSAVGRGITLAGVDKDALGNAIPVQTIYANTTVSNNAGGLIKGDTDSGIAINGVSGSTTFTVTINNAGGATIEGGGATAGAIDGRTVGNGITINNAGTIQADNSGLAIALGSGTNAVNITGGSAHIRGDITGGSGTNTVTINTGAGNSFNYAGTISNVSNVTIAANSSFAAGGTQPAVVNSSNVANGSLTLKYSTGSAATMNVNSANLTFALGAGSATSGSQIIVTGGVANTMAFSGANTVTINDLVGANLTLNQEYVLIDGDSTTYTGLQLGAITAFGQEITGGLNLLAANTAGNDFSQLYAGSHLYLLNGNIEVGVAAVPEPQSWLLALIGLTAGIFIHVRRRLAV